MPSNVVTISVVVVVAISGIATGQPCAAGSIKEINGNWFCSPVKAIQYNNVGSPGTYKEITAMNADGTCDSQPKSFNGPLAPLDEEVSVHFRGPLQLKQLAVYTPSNQTEQKAHRNPTVHQHRSLRHYHQNNHQRDKAEESIQAAGQEKRQMVTATIDGQVISWENNWMGTPTPVAPAGPAIVTVTINGQIVSWVNNYFGPANPTTLATIAIPSITPAHPTKAQTSSVSPNSILSAPVAVVSPPNLDLPSNFQRIGYYNSASQTVENLVFLGNFGGQGSGVWDATFGSSLSYIGSAGTGGALTPQILADTVIPSDSEVVVMLGQECEDGGCGYVRPGSVAHHGVAGGDKIFLFEFSMPLDGKTGFNGDMPSIWLLNAKIPRTLQYGKANCSCWESGCGELDIAEALFSGSTYLKSTVHTNKPGGASDYLVRPVSATMKLAVIFSANTSTIRIQVMNNNAEFAMSLSVDDVNVLCENIASNKVSYFPIT